ncbi:DUF3667 domain-containing protein [Mucilaginibacter panaciglaebae]|uniref:DUF3667 domain-containing protein n=1 Tax=Mucilaginibacter panaciglaebae TaxID=502331 RepID=A0ABP7X6K3_9SPHI
MKKHYRKENDCANCGTELQGKFCHVCGQENLELRESFGHVMNHTISDYFHFDHQFFHTFKPLLFQPGKLTIEYMLGKRAQYLHPVKMYIFISLVFFLLFFKNDAKDTKLRQSNNPKSKKELAATKHQLDSLIQDPKTSKLEKSILKTAQSNNKVVLNESGDVDFVTETPDKNKKLKNHITFWDGDDADEAIRMKDTTYELYLARQAKLSPGKKDNFIVRYVRKREYELNASGEDINNVILEGIKHNAPKMMFLLLPLFALLLKIAFWKSRKFYVEHLIYSFHFHCFLFLFMSMIILIKMMLPHSWDIGDYLDSIAVLVIIWYTYKSLRVMYHRTARRTITKMLGLFFSYSFVFLACMGILAMAVALFD